MATVKRWHRPAWRAVNALAFAECVALLASLLWAPPATERGRLILATMAIASAAIVALSTFYIAAMERRA